MAAKRATPAARRRRLAPSYLVAVLLLALFVVNYQLFVSLLIPLGSLLFFLPRIGAGNAFAAAAALAFVSPWQITDAARTTPWAPTPSADLNDLLDIIGVQSGLFLELGSGDGRNLLLAAQRGFSQSIGLELSPALVALSRLRLWLAQINGTVHRADVLTAALPAEASVVYLYLSREALETLAPRLACAYHSRGTLVLSRGFELPDWSPPFERLERGPTTLLAYNASDASDACVE